MLRFRPSLVLPALLLVLAAIAWVVLSPDGARRDAPSAPAGATSAQGSGAATDPVAAAPNPASPGNVTLGPGEPLPPAALPEARLRGRIADRLDVPIPGASVLLYTRYGSTPLRTTETDPTGAFELQAPGGEGYALRIAHPEFAPLPPLRHLALDAAQPLQLGTLCLESGRSLQADVLMPSGAPLAGVRAQLRPALQELGGPFGEVAVEATSDSVGRFAFYGLADRDYALLLEPPAPWAPLRIPQLRPGGPGERRRFVLQQGHVLRGLVRDAQGRPRPEALVRLVSEEGQLPRELRTDASGQFSVHGLLAGAWRCHVRARPSGPETRVAVVLPRAEPLSVSLERGGELRLHLLAPEPLPPAAELRLRRTGALEPLVFEAVPVAGSGLTLEGLDTGPWEGELRVPGFAPAALEPFALGPVPHELRIRLVRGATLTGRVLGRDGGPVPGLELLVTRPRPSGAARLLVRDLELARTRCDAEGRYRLAGLPAGPVRILLGPPDGTHRELASLELASGEDHTLDLRWPPGEAELVLRLAPHLEPPLEVLVRPLDGGPARRRRFVDRSEQILRDVAPGRLLVHRVGAENQPELVQVSEKTRVVVVLR